MMQEDSILYIENIDERETQLLATCSVAIIFVANSFLIGEICGKLRFLEIIISSVVITLLFFRRLFGGSGSNPLLFMSMLFGLLGFMFTVKAFMNLE